MIRSLAFATLLLATAFAVQVQAAECEYESEACHGGGYCDLETDSEAVCPQADGPDAPTYGVCEGEVCAYGEEDCIWCSAPIDEETDTAGDVKESKGIPALSILGYLAVLGALVMVRRYK